MRAPRLTALIGGGIALALLAGCGPTPSRQGGAASGPVVASVAPGNAALAAQRTAAGIPDCEAPTSAAPPLQEGLPPVVLPCLGSDRAVDVSQLRGRPMLVNLWAQWCGPCKAEAPILREIHALSDGKLRVVGVDYADGDPAAAIAFAKASGWTYEQLADPAGTLREHMGVPGIPVTLLVDADGSVVYRVTGQVSSLEQLKRIILDKLGVAL